MILDVGLPPLLPWERIEQYFYSWQIFLFFVEYLVLVIWFWMVASTSSSRKDWEIFSPTTNLVLAVRPLTSRFESDYDVNNNLWFGSVYFLVWQWLRITITMMNNVEYANCPYSSLSHQSFQKHRVVSNGLY